VTPAERGKGVVELCEFRKTCFHKTFIEFCEGVE